MSKSEMNLSYGILFFSFFEEHSYYIPERLLQFTFPQMCTGVLFSLNPWQSLIFVFIFFITAILKVVNWYLIVILIYILLMISDVKQLFMFLLAIWMYYLGKDSSVHFLIKLFISQSNCSFLNTELDKFLICLNINSLSNIWCADVFLFHNLPFQWVHFFLCC